MSDEEIEDLRIWAASQVAAFGLNARRAGALLRLIDEHQVTTSNLQWCLEVIEGELPETRMKLGVT